jgi:hypothetical protein
VLAQLPEDRVWEAAVNGRGRPIDRIRPCGLVAILCVRLTLPAVPSDDERATLRGRIFAWASSLFFLCVFVLIVAMRGHHLLRAQLARRASRASAQPGVTIITVAFNVWAVVAIINHPRRGRLCLPSALARGRGRQLGDAVSLLTLVELVRREARRRACSWAAAATAVSGLRC